METADLEPVIIEDLIRIGEDLGIEKGIEKGIERGVETGRLEMARQSLLDLIDARGLVPSDAQRARISNERALEPLRMWLRRAATADSVDDVFAGE